MKRHLSVLRDDKGNVAILFALAAFALLIAGGAAIDMSRKFSWDTRLQAATDAAALAAASSGGSQAHMQQTVQDYFQRNFTADSELTSPSLSITLNGTALQVSASAQLKASFMSLAGISALPVDALSEVSTGDSSLEVALVLDVSGSMQASLGSGSRIDVLKQAAKSLLDTVSDNGANMSRVKIGVVPFNMDVNLGTNYSQYVQGAGNALFNSQPWAGCVVERAGANAYSDTYDGGNSATGKWMAFAWPPEPNNPNNYNCVNPNNGTNGGYATVDPPNGYRVMTAGPNYNCVRHSIMPLSGNYTDVTQEIDSLTAEGNQGTIIAPGMGWGLRVLSPAEPFTEGSSYNAKTKKVLIVLTDGEQTTEAEYGTNSNCPVATNSSQSYVFNPAVFGLPGNSLSGNGPRDTFSPYGYIKDSNPFGTNPQNWSDVANDLYNVSIASCNAVKQAGGNYPIEVYTIAVSGDAGPGTVVNTLLKNCASQPSNFFLATDDTALLDAFKAIAKQIKTVRLSR